MAMVLLRDALVGQRRQTRFYILAVFSSGIYAVENRVREALGLI
jgi:hypothetical protein